MQINEAEVSENEEILLEEYKHNMMKQKSYIKMKEAKKGEVAGD